MQSRGAVEKLRGVAAWFYRSRRCSLIDAQCLSGLAVHFHGHLAKLALHASVLGDGAIELPGDVHTQQALLLTVLLPLRPQAREVGGHTLNSADDAGDLDLVL